MHTYTSGVLESAAQQLNWYEQNQTVTIKGSGIEAGTTDALKPSVFFRKHVS